MGARRTLAEYMALQYPITLRPDPSGEGYLAEHPDLDGCMSQGGSPAEAVGNLEEARALWMEVRLDEGLPIPEPIAEEPSGRLLVRMPPWLHARLTDLAQRQRVSLNQLLVSALAAFSGSQPYREELPALRKALEDLQTTVSEARRQFSWTASGSQALDAADATGQMAGASLAHDSLAQSCAAPVGRSQRSSLRLVGREWQDADSKQKVSA